MLLFAIYLLVGSIALARHARAPLAAGIVLLVGVGRARDVSRRATAIGSPLRTGALTAGRAALPPLRDGNFSRAAARGLAPARGPRARRRAGRRRRVDLERRLEGRVPLLEELGPLRPAEGPGRRPLCLELELPGHHVPEEGDVVLRIKAQKDAVYWRATTLDEYTGVGWRESAGLAPATQSAEIDEALQDPTLPAAAAPRHGTGRGRR